jgi:hypothetical protein
MPLWRRVLKWLVLVGLTAAIRYSFGRTTLIVLFAIAVIAVLYVHAIWLPRGVNGWTAVPRDKYYALRGWPPPKD